MAQRFCMKCGKPLNAADKFCIYCGTPTGKVGPAVVPGPAPVPQPERPKNGRWGKRGKSAPQPMPVPQPIQQPRPVPQPIPQPIQQQTRPVVQPHPVPQPQPLPVQQARPVTQPRPVPQPQPVQQPRPRHMPEDVSVLPGDEVTSVLDEKQAFPDMGNDEQTTVLGPTLAVTLERQRTGETYKLDLPSVIGKGSAADCRITNNTAISRRHIRIMADETTGGTPHIVMEDLGSLNKTRLNGDPISRGVPRALLDGDTITLADETFVVHIHEV